MTGASNNPKKRMRFASSHKLGEKKQYESQEKEKYAHAAVVNVYPEIRKLATV
jgi:hypothetical protein